MADAENFFFPLLIVRLEGRWKANLLAGLLACLWVLEVNAHQPLCLEEEQAETRVILADKNSLFWESITEERSREKTCKRKCRLRSVLTMRSNLRHYIFREAVEETSLLELNSALTLTEASFFWAVTAALVLKYLQCGSEALQSTCVGDVPGSCWLSLGIKLCLGSAS